MRSIHSILSKRSHLLERLTKHLTDIQLANQWDQGKEVGRVNYSTLPDKMTMYVYNIWLPLAGNKSMETQENETDKKRPAISLQAYNKLD